jgi:hypothetical protein
MSLIAVLLYPILTLDGVFFMNFFSILGPGDAMSTQIMAHKRQALALKREGRLAEAKEELRKAKILEKQAEEMALLGQAEGEDEASDDDEIHALIRGLEREEKLKGNAGKGGASQKSIPEDFSLGFSFVDDDDDAHVEVCSLYAFNYNARYSTL